MDEIERRCRGADLRSRIAIEISVLNIAFNVLMVFLTR